MEAAADAAGVLDVVINWCRGCDGFGYTGWLWWKKVCTVCRADPKHAYGDLGFTQPAPAREPSCLKEFDERWAREKAAKLNRIREEALASEQGRVEGWLTAMRSMQATETEMRAASGGETKA